MTNNAIFNVADINGTNGFTINGQGTYSRSSYSVAGIGDINADGFNDICIGSNGADQAYVVFGTNTTISSLSLSQLNGINGFAVNAITTSDDLGWTVNKGGDINRDGKADFIISADGYGSSRLGQVYIIYGQRNFVNSQFSVLNLNGTNGFAVSPIDGRIGDAISSCDINGDGHSDIIIGSQNANGNNGQVYVVYGQSSNYPPIVYASSLDGINGFVINGLSGSGLGNSVGCVGDINNDGSEEFVLGASTASNAYVIFGKSKGFGQSFSVSDLNGGNGFVVNPLSSSDALGCAVGGGGDINGDGVSDILLGACNANGGVGQAYVIFGTRSGIYTSPFELSSLDGAIGFIVNGIHVGDNLGSPVLNIGDINNDGHTDILIGAANVNNAAGQSYILYGKSIDDSFNTFFSVTSLNGKNGFIVNGIDHNDFCGFSADKIDDFNGDNYSD